MDIVPPAPAKGIFLLLHRSELSDPREAKSYCKAMIFKTDGLRRVKSEQLMRDVKLRKVKLRKAYKYLLEEAEEWKKKVEEIEEGFTELKMESMHHSLRGKLYFSGLPSEWQTDPIEKNEILCTITNTESRSLPYLDDPKDDDDADDDAEDEKVNENEFEDEDDSDENDLKYLRRIKYLRKRIIWMKLEVKYLEPYLRSTQERYARQAKIPYYKTIYVGHPTKEPVRYHQRLNSKDYKAFCGQPGIIEKFKALSEKYGASIKNLVSEMIQTGGLDCVTAVDSSSFGAMGTPLTRARELKRKREEELNEARRGKMPATAYTTPSRSPVGFMAEALQKSKMIGAVILGWNLMKKLMQSWPTGSEFRDLPLLDAIQRYPSLQKEFNEGLTLIGQGHPIDDEVEPAWPPYQFESAWPPDPVEPSDSD
ncbi:hypothetical protein SLE2022_397260 [Rubroshorea leprosula]